MKNKQDKRNVLKEVLHTLKIGDYFIIIAIVLSIFAVVGFTYSYHNTTATTVEVRIEGVVVEQLDLSQNIEKEYETDHGFNVVRIQDRKVTIIEADCLDQICVDTRDGEYTGDSIVCVPNHFSVEVIGGEAEIDVLSQ